MWVRVETELDCSAEKAWREVQKPALLEKISWPLVTFAPSGAGFPDRWRQGDTVDVRCAILGVLPMGVHSLRFERIDDASMQIQTREHDPLIPKWDHKISIESLAPNRCRYRDEIELGAGKLTPIIWAWAKIFYEHRQRGWRKIAPSL